jgi:hypothetical protein
MVRGVITRVAAAAGALVAAVALSLSAAPAAHAAPAKPPAPTTITIAGNGIQDKITIQKADKPEVFDLLLSEVSWLGTATPQTYSPGAKALGAKYTVTVLAKNAPQAVYELFPAATGGPRAHRAAKQPTGKKADGWFYGRLTMSESLRVSGVPLKAQTGAGVMNGGIGGGFVEQANVKDEFDPVASAETMFGEMRRLFLLNGAVLVVVLFGLAGVAFLIRRKV